MTDWAGLKHAYGEATDTPRLLAQLSPGPSSDDVWRDLWSCLCHQGTVYPASYAALPYLLETAAQWPPHARIPPLGLAASIVVCQDERGRRDEFLHGLTGTVQDLHRLALETLSAEGLSREDFIYLLEDIRAFEYDRRFGGGLNYLADGELPGECPSCDGPLYFVIGKYGFFCTADYGIGRPHVKRESLAPVAASRLEGTAKWLFDTAIRARQTEVAEWMLYVFGTTTCPSCGNHVQIAKSAGLVE